MTLRIRPATIEDAAGINGVYNPYVTDTVATFEIEALSDADRRAWIASLARDPRYRIFLAIEHGEVVGFANSAPFDPRPAYGTSVKVSVFLRPEAQGRRLGHRLYEALFTALGAAPVHRAYALIVPPNPASFALHERFGFRHLATLNEVGFKFGRYLDVAWFERRC